MAKKRNGRPPKLKAERLSHTYAFRVTEGEAKRINRAARAFGRRTAGAWIRNTILAQANAVTGATR